MIDPKQLAPGTTIRHRPTGAVRVLDRRKDDDTGWWMTDRSGLDDRVWADGDWLAPGQLFELHPTDVLAQVESRLGRIEAAINQLRQEVANLSQVQTDINNDVATLTQALADFATEWSQISAQVAAAAPQIDTSKLDALAGQAQAMDTAWKAQLAAPVTATSTGTAATGTAPAESTPTATMSTATDSATTTTPGTGTPAPGTTTTA